MNKIERRRVSHKMTTSVSKTKEIILGGILKRNPTIKINNVNITFRSAADCNFKFFSHTKSLLEIV